jgi:hypothetical protein
MGPNRSRNADSDCDGIQGYTRIVWKQVRCVNPRQDTIQGIKDLLQKTRSQVELKSKQFLRSKSTQRLNRPSLLFPV